MASKSLPYRSQVENLNQNWFDVLNQDLDINDPQLDGQTGQPHFVDAILGQQRNGFFIECGAADGRYQSNSLLFELFQGLDGPVGGGQRRVVRRSGVDEQEGLPPKRLSQH
ncbi:unnamed protein product [Sphagnum tenellum]